MHHSCFSLPRRRPNLAHFPCSTCTLARLASYDHTTVTIPHPIRTAKSSTVGPNQYFSGGPCGNLGCRRAGRSFCFSLPRRRRPNLAHFPCSTVTFARSTSYDHTTVTIPHPIRTAKSSTVGPNQYFSGGPCGNLGCRRAGPFFWPFTSVIWTVFPPPRLTRCGTIRESTHRGGGRAGPRPRSNIPSRPFG